MIETNEYEQVLRHFARKSLIMHDLSDFHPVLRFFFIDALAHIDYTLGTLAYNYMSIRNEMGREYLRWRVDEEEKGDRARFPAFINWLKANHPETFASLPVVWRIVYDTGNAARYMSLRLIVDPDSTQPIPSGFFFNAVEEFFARPFLMGLYNDSELARLFERFVALDRAGGSAGP